MKGGVNMAIITISRQVASLGDEIARSVAGQLAYDCIDKQKIIEALTSQGFSADDIERYDEKKPSIWHRFSERRKKILHLIQAAVYDFATRQNVVIVGRGSQVLLKDLPGILHVRVMAPHATRLQRLMDQNKCAEKEAEQIILRSDRDSAEFINAYFEADWEDPSLYDLILNTRTISMETGAKLIMQMVAADEFKEAPQSAMEELIDLALTRKVMAALLDIAGLDVTSLRIEKGVADISGLARSEVIKELCHRTVSSIEGIEKVHIKIEVMDIVNI